MMIVDTFLPELKLVDVLPMDFLQPVSIMISATETDSGNTCGRRMSAQ